MPIVTLEFTQPLNVSCQVGDAAYYVNTQANSTFTENATDIVEIGTIVEILDAKATPSLKVYSTLDGWSGELSNEQFILFSKDNKANLSSALGYYAEVKMSTSENTTQSELHAVGVDMFTSSK
tara:strand:+ start:1060 stop:1428 length:369 start_codon:yes stop_codon:yes gene_type:complete